jgi:hypothetical protein
MGVDIGDYDRDGRIDMINPCVRKQSYTLYRNEGQYFVDASSQSGLAETTSEVTGFGPNFLDYDNDGDLDLFLVRRYLVNRLLRNDGGFKFADVTPRLIDEPHLTFGAAWGDYDNDGDLDLFVVNNTRDMSRLFRNDSAGDAPAFADVTDGPLRRTGASIAAAWVDVDGDGDLDLTASDWDDAVLLFRNDIRNGNHWLKFRLVGTRSNTWGVGARVRVVAGGKSQMRLITGGSPAASEVLEVAFGLGAATRADLVEVRWPSGIVQTLRDQVADRRILIREAAD